MSANPFKAFEQIRRARATPSCSTAPLPPHDVHPRPRLQRGRSRSSVINDHFWVLFWIPTTISRCGTRGSSGSTPTGSPCRTSRGRSRLFSALTDRHRSPPSSTTRRARTPRRRSTTRGLGYGAIWKGQGLGAPLLTVYRHFDSASVHEGPLETLPKTLWVIDFPLFERIYYSLVAGFDVYGTVGLAGRPPLHGSAAHRGESYFLDFLPAEARLENHEVLVPGEQLQGPRLPPGPMPSAISYATQDPKREFIERLVGQELRPEAGMAFDPVNYLKAGEDYPPFQRAR
ncbi:MAG: fatty acid cis/trans isomerase [Anaeromyxobacter sp.]|nr:fatty acid cis/trans isomerase [Anaeromyxobacter sp.]